MKISAVLAGALYFLSFPPFNLWYLIFPALYFFYRALLLSKNGFSSGFIFGSIAYSVILLGIKSIGYEAWIPLTILMGSTYGVFGVIFVFFKNKFQNHFFVLIGVISSFDLMRAYFPFGGFPWGFSSTVLLTSYSEYSTYLLPNLFKTYGPSGLSLIIQSFVLFLVLFISESKKGRILKSFTGYVFLISIPLLISTVDLFNFEKSNATKEGLTISIVQGNSPCPGTKNKCSNERQRIYESHLNLTKEINQNVNLVVWPESSTGFNNDPLVHKEVLGEIQTEAKRLDSYFLIGGDRPIGNENFENYGVFINTQGLVIDQYLKQHPVPFGEYIPFRKYLDWIPPLAQVPRDMIRGDREKILYLDEVRIASVISFEGSFQRYIRKSVNQGAEVIIILTNQASYGESGMSDQFILMSQANAISNNRPIVHAAITGKSAFINNLGNVISKTDLFTTSLLTETIYPVDSVTFYSRYGNYFNYMSLLIALMLIFFKKFFTHQID